MGALNPLTQAFVMLAQYEDPKQTVVWTDTQGMGLHWAMEGA